MRTIIELTDEQLAALKRLCEREKISRAEAVRRAVDKLITEQEDDKSRKDAAMRSAFGAWKHLRPEIGDSVEYVRELRSEWDRRESSIRHERPD